MSFIPKCIGHNKSYHRLKNGEFINLNDETLKEISQSVLPEYLQIVPILRGTKSLNNFISNVLKRDESTLINERKLFAAYQSQHPLDSVLNWEL